MSGRACILSSGIWEIRDIVKAVTGLEPVSGKNRAGADADYDYVLGWGRRPTAAAAMALARETGKPYVSLEDGFLRSIYPGRMQKPASLVADRIGVHYDANSRSDFEAAVTKAAAKSCPAINARARAGMHMMRELSLSKYNHAPLMSERAMGLGARPAGGRILVVDQTMHDGAVSYGMAGAQSFQHMLEAAKAENADAQIIVKTHPEVVSGRKPGYLTGMVGADVRVIDYEVNPWSLIMAADRVYAVTSLLGFEALMAGLPVHCFGASFYSGWGLTRDRIRMPRRRARPSREHLFAAAYFDYARYADPQAARQVSFEEAAITLARQRDFAHFGEGPRQTKRAARAEPLFSPATAQIGPALAC